MSDDGVEVAVLGPVDVRGARRSRFTAPPRSSSSCTWPFTAAASGTTKWAQAIWPDRPVPWPPSTRRRPTPGAALGAQADGVAHLPRGGRLRLGEPVTTDVERFAALAAATDDPRRLAQAFRLVRGPLFAGLRRADWAVLDGTQRKLEALVVGAALRGAEACLSRARVTRPNGWSGGPCW